MTPGSVAALLHGGLVVGGIVLYVIVTRLSHQRRPPSAAIAWLGGILTVPYVAVPLFLLIGSRKLVHGPPTHAPGELESDPAGPSWARETLVALGVPGAQPCHDVHVHADGHAALEDLLCGLARAQHGIAVNIFLFAQDPTGLRITGALLAAARRGVAVRVLVDTVGSWATLPLLARRLRRHGAQLLFFAPPWRRPRVGRANLRNHRKIVVVDGDWLWSGGRNFASEYFIEDSDGTPPWEDLGFSTRGPLALQALASFDDAWQDSGGSLPVPVATPVPNGPCNGAPAQWVESGPDRPDDVLFMLLLTAIFHARSRILAVTPYFVPDDSLLTALEMAARRGVTVDLLVPRRSNHRLADLAGADALRQLAGMGARIHRLDHMVHAKALVIDDGFAWCGSANLDTRSLFLNYEAVTVFYGAGEVAAIADWIETRIARATRWPGSTPTLTRAFVEGVVRHLAFQM